MRNEDYGRIARILADGTPVTLEATIVNKTYPEGRTSYNAIAEIAGSDKKDQVVMLGGHLDSWHSATGATDNAIGCAIMMEAARILKVIGVAAAPDDPRRALERRRGRPARIARLREAALRIGRERRRRSSPRSPATSTSTPARAGHAAPRSSVRPRRPRSFARFWRRSRICRSRAPRRRRAAPREAPTARRSTTRGCPASASARIRSSTAATPITRTWTPTSASSKRTSATPRSSWRPRSTSSRCATRCCPASRRPTCRLRRRSERVDSSDTGRGTDRATKKR